MNKSMRFILPLLFLSVISGCSTISDERPEPIRKSEYYLEHGVNAFEESRFIDAADFFRKALAHYRSIDNSTGILLSRINLAETSLALGNFKLAHAEIRQAQKIEESILTSEYRDRLSLLQAQVYWRAGKRSESLDLLEPLLPQFDVAQKPVGKTDANSVGAVTLRTDIAMTEADGDRTTAEIWLTRLSKLISNIKDEHPLHKARLLRFEAKLAQSQQEYSKALDKLQQALVLYRDSAIRPAIAATLSEQGDIYMQTEHWKAAINSFEKASYIRLWIADQVGAKAVMIKLRNAYQKGGHISEANNLSIEIDKIDSRNYITPTFPGLSSE